MNNFANSISVITYDIAGREADILIPIFDSYPEDMNFVCACQQFGTGASDKNVIITLVCTNKQGRRIKEDIDITDACKPNSPIRLCIVKTDMHYELITYCDYAHNGKFRLSDVFCSMMDF